MGLGRSFSSVGGWLQRNAQKVAAGVSLASLLIPGGQGFAVGLASLTGALDDSLAHLYQNPDGSPKQVGGFRLDHLLIFAALALSAVVLWMIVRNASGSRRYQGRRRWRRYY